LFTFTTFPRDAVAGEGGPSEGWWMGAGQDETEPQGKSVSRKLRHEPTTAEVILWYNVRRRQVEGARFRRQHPIGTYVVDFFCTELGLAIEVDGATHLDRERQDEKRQAKLESMGVTLLRFRDEEVLHGLGGVLETVAGAVRRMRARR